MKTKKNLKDFLLFLLIGVIAGMTLAITQFFMTLDVKNETATTQEIIYVVDRDYSPALENEIKNSKKFIYVIMFQTGYKKFLQDLADAKKRGVDVRVILEGGEDYLGEVFKDTANKTFEFLEKNGIDVKFDKENTTTHAKLIITESSVLVGSTNWSFYSIFKNHETNVIIKSESAVKFFKKYFDELWYEDEEPAPL